MNFTIIAIISVILILFIGNKSEADKQNISIKKQYYSSVILTLGMFGFLFLFTKYVINPEAVQRTLDKIDKEYPRKVTPIGITSDKQMETSAYQIQLNKLMNWKYLDYLPSNIDKDLYIDLIARSDYPYYLAMIHYMESSFDTNANKGSYYGLGQHNKEFMHENGYSLKEYRENWIIQVEISLAYIKKYVKKEPNSAGELYAYWLNSSWNGTEQIYCKKNDTKKFNPYYSNKNLDLNKNKCIEISDLNRKFATFINK